MRARLICLVVLAGLSLTATAAASLDAGDSLRFGFVPQRTFQGQPASLSVVVRPTGSRCTASIRYADRSLQTLPAVRSSRRQGELEVADPRQGEDRLGHRDRQLREGRKGGPQLRGRRAADRPGQVVILKNGFSQRVMFSTRKVSYGIELSNPSPENDALEVDVLVNFLDATNRVVDTDTTNVDAIGAGTIYYLGGSTSIPDASRSRRSRS